MPNSGLINEQTSGVYIISITPFYENGSIDFKSVDSLVEFFLEKDDSILLRLQHAVPYNLHSKEFLSSVIDLLFVNYLLRTQF